MIDSTEFSLFVLIELLNKIESLQNRYHIKCTVHGVWKDTNNTSNGIEQLLAYNNNNKDVKVEIFSKLPLEYRSKIYDNSLISFQWQ